MSLACATRLRTSNVTRIRPAIFFSTASSDPDTSSIPSPTPQPSTSTRHRALSLYRRLLRASDQMPTPNRRNYIATKTRLEFRKHMRISDPEEIEFCLRLADTNLDTVMVQAEHLSRLFNDPEYQNYN
ncbi:hypothetical protein HJC23_006396 [Cyclotella cryptica]|uniref:Complex 1 LYR protein domain-containing protein n=1 Tax=Cyclotella cryptica TaxID=29204 RepID=A0ABD3QUP2_9STRA